MLLRLLPYAGWPLAGVLFWFWLGAREDLAAEIERCNVDKLASIAKAEQVAREATEAAHLRRITELESQAQRERKAREIAEAARIEAENRPVEVRTVIQRIADEHACLTTLIPDAVVDRLRD